MNRVKVLLAEDDADDRGVFSYFLSGRNDITLLPFAENGEEVFGFLNSIRDPQHMPDFIILDHNMPKMNGRQTLELLKANPVYAQIPVFVYSTYVDETLSTICKELGAAAVLSKPLTAEGYQVMMDDCLSCVLLKQGC